MRRPAIWACVAVAVLGYVPGGERDACAQTPPQSSSPSSPPVVPGWRAWRPALVLGGGWLGRDVLGEVEAATRAATTGTATPPGFTLFRTASHLGGAPRFDGGIVLPITSSLAIEIGGTAGRPTLTTRISRDAENAPAASATERVAEYTAGVRASLDIPRWTWRRRLSPFVAVGGAYLRQLHDENVLVETGQAWSAAGGVRWWVSSGPRRRTLGVTADLGWTWRTGGIAFTDGARSMPSVSVRVFAGL